MQSSYHISQQINNINVSCQFNKKWPYDPKITNAEKIRLLYIKPAIVLEFLSKITKI